MDSGISLGNEEFSSNESFLKRVLHKISKNVFPGIFMVLLPLWLYLSISNDGKYLKETVIGSLIITFLIVIKLKQDQMIKVSKKKF